MQVIRLILTQQIDNKSASLLLYAQTANSNLRQTSFNPFRHEVILHPRDAAEAPLDEYVWKDADFEEEEDDEAAEPEPPAHLNSSSTPQKFSATSRPFAIPNGELHQARTRIAEIKEEMEDAIDKEDGEAVTVAFDKMMRMVDSLGNANSLPATK